MIFNVKSLPIHVKCQALYSLKMKIKKKCFRMSYSAVVLTLEGFRNIKMKLMFLIYVFKGALSQHI